MFVACDGYLLEATTICFCLPSPLPLAERNTNTESDTDAESDQEVGQSPRIPIIGQRFKQEFDREPYGLERRGFGTESGRGAYSLI